MLKAFAAQFFFPFQMKVPVIRWSIKSSNKRSHSFNKRIEFLGYESKAFLSKGLIKKWLKETGFIRCYQPISQISTKKKLKKKKFLQFPRHQSYEFGAYDRNIGKVPHPISPKYWVLEWLYISVWAFYPKAWYIELRQTRYFGGVGCEAFSIKRKMISHLSLYKLNSTYNLISLHLPLTPSSHTIHCLKSQLRFTIISRNLALFNHCFMNPMVRVGNPLLGRAKFKLSFMVPCKGSNRGLAIYWMGW